MNFRSLRHVLGVALAAAAAAACSSNGPPPTVFMASTIQAGSVGPACDYGSQTTWIDIGIATGVDPVTVGSGGSSTDGKISASCSVHPAGNGFDISLSATLYGLKGGTVTITSPPGQGAVTTSGASGITMIFQNATGKYTSDACTLTYTYSGEAVPRSPPIASGRIWAHVSCPMALDNYGMILTNDGGIPKSCDTEADFLFEYCGE